MQVKVQELSETMKLSESHPLSLFYEVTEILFSYAMRPILGLKKYFEKRKMCTQCLNA